MALEIHSAGAMQHVCVLGPESVLTRTVWCCMVRWDVLKILESVLPNGPPSTSSRSKHELRTLHTGVTCILRYAGVNFRCQQLAVAPLVFNFRNSNNMRQNKKCHAYYRMLVVLKMLLPKNCEALRRRVIWTRTSHSSPLDSTHRTLQTGRRTFLKSVVFYWTTLHVTDGGLRCSR